MISDGKPQLGSDAKPGCTVIYLILCQSDQVGRSVFIQENQLLGFERRSIPDLEGGTRAIEVEVLAIPSHTKSKGGSGFKFLFHNHFVVGDVPDPPLSQSIAASADDRHDRVTARAVRRYQEAHHRQQRTDRKILQFACTEIDAGKSESSLM